MSITIQALGRPTYLGQLYNATTSALIPGFRLFNTSEIKPIKTAVSSTDIKYEEVKTVKEKANSLNISAQLSVSILSGAIDISGMGSYLKSDSESSDSITVVAIGQYRTYNESLDINQLLQSLAMSGQQLANMGATHVITSITYGGNIVGSLTQKQDLSSSDLDVKGKFSLEVFKGMGKMFGASGSAELSVEEKKKLNSYNLNVKLVADFFSKGDEIPANAPDLLATFKKSPNLIGDGVPCEIILTPLAWLQTGIPTFRELADADILELTDLYDSILLLGQNRSALSADASTHKELFPSFLTSCRKSNLRVSHLVQQARQELRSFLEATRSVQSDVKTPIEFREEIEGRFEEEKELFDQDHDEWLSMMERVRAAKKHGFPPATISELRGIMSRQVKGAVAIILIPESVQFARLLATYRELAEDIRKWRATVDDNTKDEKEQSSENATSYVSIYADAHLDKELLKLDDETKSIAHALKTARDCSSPVFLTYGLTRNTLVELKWSVLNQEGWGVLVNHEEGWRYIGDVHKGARHGVGVITYADGSVYQGGWFEGKRDGSGEMFPPQTRSASGQLKGGSKGVYIDNVRVSDGVVVKVTVYRGGSPIQFSHVALRTGDATISHVDKIGRVLGWQLGKRYRLKMESPTNSFRTFEILVNGTRVDPSEDPDVEATPWPLDSDGEKLITAVAL